MAISRESSATNNGTTVTIGTHAANDLIVILAYRDNNNSGPTLPSGWYGIFSGGGNSTGMTVGWKRATTASETSGTWTNATSLHAIVYRPGTDKIVVPKYYSGAGASSVSVQVAGQPAGTFESNSDDLWLIAFIAQRNSSNSLETATWTGLTNVTSSTDSSVWQAVVNDTNATRTAAWGSQIATVTNSASWQTRLLGLQEVPTQSAGGGGGGIFFRPGMSGGMGE
jgi:hypothetical protein